MFNKLFLTAHAARTESLDPLQKYRFRVIIPSISAEIGFSTVSGLDFEIGVSEYSEGGYPYAHKIPGKPKVSEVTCERGLYAGNSDMLELVRSTLTNSDFRQTVIIQHLTRSGAVGKEYKLAECWASKWETDGLDASSDDVAMETLTLQYEYQLDE